MRIDDVKYAQSGEISIAWQRYGNPDGVPVVTVPPLATCMELLWEWPANVHYMERWGSFCDVVHFDKRGSGSSDRIEGAPSIEERMDDIGAVMDAAGLERAVLYGLSEGGAMAMLFAATYPERVPALVLHGTFPRILEAPDYSPGVSAELVDQFVNAMVDTWATPETILLPFFVPSQLGNDAYLRFLLRFQRAAATPRTIRKMLELNNEIDVRHVVSAIHCPTLIVHADGDPVVSVEHSRWLAERIPNATFATYPGKDHYPGLDHPDEQLDLIEEFLTGELRAAATDRVLATVLFTDIVDSTTTATSLGDAAWRSLLDEHDQALHRQIARHGGRVVHGTGDGLLATFDSPSRAIRAAEASVAAARGVGVAIRAGLHTGEVERRGDDVAGIGVHIAARVAGLACAGEVLVSGAVPPLVAGSPIAFADRGEHRLKGIDGDWRLFAAQCT